MTNENKEVTTALLAGIEKRHGEVGNHQQAREREIEARAEGNGLRRSELAMDIVFLADRGCPVHCLR
jgi:hypothetical protein